MRKYILILLKSFFLVLILGVNILVPQKAFADPAIDQVNGSWVDLFYDNNPTNSVQDGVSSSIGLDRYLGEWTLKDNAWYDFNWTYRKQITVNNSNAASLTNYQVSLTIDSAALIGAGKMLADGRDIRFTDFNSTTIYDYWIESGINTASTKIWVKISSLPVGDTIIHIYYGNAGAASSSSFINTMEIPPAVWWSKSYDGGATTDQAFTATTDSSDNVIVGGASNSDFYTIKYDPNGNVLWNRSYNGGASDQINGVAVDLSNNVIVTGYSTIDHSGRIDKDYYTIKYDPDGNVLWSKSYDGGSVEQANGVAVDSGNNVIVTGYSRTGTNDNFYTIKYDSAGNEIITGWPKSYDNTGIANGSDQANSVSIDSNDNVIVAGQSRNSTSSKDDFYTIKYNSAGTSLWEKRYNTTVNNRATAVAIDSSNNVVVSGYNSTTISNNDIRAIKYDASGNEIWNNLYSTADNDQANGIDINDYDNVIIAIKIKSGTNFNYGVSKYDSTGNLIWNTTYDSGSTPDSSQAIAIDNDNNIIVTGYNATNDFYTIKYSEHKFADAVPTYVFGTEASKVESGSINSTEIIPTTLYGWNQFSWTDSEPSGTNILFTLEAWNGSVWVLPSLLDASSNANGNFDVSPVPLSSLDISTYSKIRIKADFSTTDPSQSPTLTEWRASWFTTDTTAPTITSISSNKADGSYKAGEIIDIDVTFSEAVTSTGNVIVTLETGTIDQICTIAITNSTTGTCNYTVQAGDTSSDLNAAISGTIADQAANPLTNYVPAATLAVNKALVIDTTAPATPVINIVASDDVINAAERTATVAVTGTNESASTVTLNGTAVTVLSATTWSYVLDAASIDAFGQGAETLTAIAIDAAGNQNTANAAKAISVDTTAPTAAISYSDTDSAVKSGDSLVITATFSEAMADNPVVKVEISGANIVSTINMTKTDSTHYTYSHTVGAGDGTATVALSVGTDDAGNVVASAPASGATFTVDNTAPTNQNTVFATSATRSGGSSVSIVSSGDFASNIWFAPSGTITFIAGLTITKASSGTATTILAPATAGSYKLFIIDAAGNVSAESMATLTVDTTAPAISETTPVATPTYDSTPNYIFTSNEAGTIAYGGDCSSVTTSASVGANTIIFNSLSSGTHSNCTIAVTDAASNPSNLLSVTAFTINTTAPTITSISSDKLNDSYKAGDIIDIDVTFSEAVTSTGNVTVTLETGAIDRTCTFSITNSSSGTCDYAVQAGDTSLDLDGTVSGIISNQASSPLTNYVPASSLSSNKALVIDTTLPTATLTYSDADMIVKAGDTLTITATFSEAMADNPVVKIEISGSNTVTAVNMTKIDTTHYTYTHAVGAGDGSATVALSVGTDDAGNVVTSVPTSGASFTVDNTAPAAVILTTSGPTTSTITLSWTAPGDDISTGTAASYDIRYSTSAITDGNWASATQVTAEPTPSITGTAESKTVSGLSSSTTYYFALKTTDEAGNISILSNIPTGTTSSSGGGGGGGGGGGSGGGSPTSSVTNMSISINAGAATTNNVNVNLTIGATNATKMAISNSSDFATASWETYATAKSWSLTTGDGIKTVHIKFQDSSGYYSTMISDTITMSVSVVPNASYPNGTLLMAVSGEKVYLIIDGQKKWIETAADFVAGGYKWEDIKKVTSAEIEAMPNYGSNGNIDPPPAPDPAPNMGKYSDGTLIKISDSFRVYVILNQKKKWISTPEVFETLGYKWGNIAIISKTELDAISDYEDNLIRAIGDYKVYLVVNGIKHHIPNPEIFLDYGFGWSDVKNVPASTVEKYRSTKLIRESKQEKIYYLSSGEVKKWIPTAEIFNSYGNKWEDIQVISKKEMASYAVSNLMRYEEKVYLISGIYKKLIPSDAIFAKNKFNKDLILDANKMEFDWFKTGSNVK